MCRQLSTTHEPGQKRVLRVSVRAGAGPETGLPGLVWVPVPPPGQAAVSRSGSFDIPLGRQGDGGWASGTDSDGDSWKAFSTEHQPYHGADHGLARQDAGFLPTGAGVDRGYDGEEVRTCSPTFCMDKGKRDFRVTHNSV